ncbi:MAG TPA: penicillin acylase family protein [Gemmatimonadales bacterium]|nr:penicillin acylase family protein [Gemmatimonadales bacterium]
MNKLSTMVAGVLLFATHPGAAQAPTDAARWHATAARVTITRDDWGIAHVHGPTDADAVFGMIYAQAEDDFNRVETNYLNALGRLAEAEGESAIWSDLRMKLFISPDTLKALYRQSPPWLVALMDGWADGLNYFLATHPDVHPRVIRHFEPWMALAFSEGSIGGDIERVSLGGLRAFYGASDAGGGAGGATDEESILPREPGGSNGIAIAPSRSANGRALLWINPHTSFYFRSELQMTSDEGLDAYGAVTWGQFFIYQGFNRTAGWMHTSSGVDNIDEYLETVEQRNGQWMYRHDGAWHPMATREITVPFRSGDQMATRRFTAYFTPHGPVVRSTDGKWVTTALMNDPMHALMQSYGRTRAKNLAEYLKVMELHTNSSNNTLFADAEGNIAYLHSNFIPRRDPVFDWSRPVDGSVATTDWHGVLSLDETPNAINPASGWAYNVNNWPWSAAGRDSPVRSAFPSYVERGDAESMRGLHALRLLPNLRGVTMSSLRDAAFDSYLPAFAIMIPGLLRAYDALPPNDARRRQLAGQVGTLRGWDFRWSAASVATSLAVYWGTELQRGQMSAARRSGLGFEQFIAERAPAPDLLTALTAASDRLAADFGKWATPWGEINRFQRLDDQIVSHFDDTQPSIPVPFTSATWGSLASYGARQYPNTKRWYGTSGNSFVAVVEFGKDSVRARAVTAGGESGNPASPHFNDQAKRYASGELRPVYFYPNQLVGHTERVYRPGQ